ncbi:ralA-binding protein 1 [Puccinia sorghi]|uniref:RalA-binding protein 1 n=1 Tax=Puccinia sorghi TaxID=27349 RepID=A0A0L6VFQ7_9BASI|nr:ralA-binding protein 1 [Puccinia sorghi]
MNGRGRWFRFRRIYTSSVRKDMDMALDHIVPEKLKIPFRAVVFPLEWGRMQIYLPTQIRELMTFPPSLIGSSISVPVTKGQLNLGTWQGI